MTALLVFLAITAIITGFAVYIVTIRIINRRQRRADMTRRVDAIIADAQLDHARQHPTTAATPTI